MAHIPLAAVVYTVTISACATTLSVLLVIAIYRLFFSPLSRFPGPKIAAFTGAYEGYYECLKDGGGRYYVEVNRMHDKYGPIVRINPWELHVRDPDWSDNIYKMTRRTSKPRWFYQFLNSSDNTFGAGPAEIHRMRRDALQPYFAASAVERHQPEVERLVEKMLGRLRELQGKEQVVNLGDVFRCLATDVATAFAFRNSFGHLDSPDFEHGSNAAVRDFGYMGMWNRQLNGKLMPALQRLPGWLSRLINPTSKEPMVFFKKLGELVITELPAAYKGAKNDEPKKSIIEQIVASSLPAEEKTPYRVMRECRSVTLAGTETTGSLLTAAAFFTLAHPAKAEKLRRELKEAQRLRGRPPTYKELKDLPYLTAIINESFRLNSVSGRLPRFDAKNDLKYKNWTIPKGVIVSTTQNDTNYSPEIFPQPNSFLPERWMDAQDRKRLSKYLFPFGRGTRLCLGMEIAYVEIYLALGRLFGPDSGLQLELHDTEAEDIVLFHDFFSPFPRTKKGLKVLVQ